MAERTRLWSRMGSWIRHAVHPGAARIDDDGSDGALRSGESATDLALSSSGGASDESGADRTVVRPPELVRLIDSIQLHLAEQSRSMEDIRATVDRVADSLSELNSHSERQAALLSDISPRVESGAAAAKKAEEALSELPRMADAQRETMVSVARQLDLLHGSAEQSVRALTEFQGSVTHLGEAGDATLSALKELRTDMKDREGRFTEEYRRMASRMNLIGWSFVGLAVVAVILAAIGLFK